MMETSIRSISGSRLPLSFAATATAFASVGSGVMFAMSSR
jgi:hypothetical protein